MCSLPGLSELGPVRDDRRVEVELAALREQVRTRGGRALGRREHDLQRVAVVRHAACPGAPHPRGRRPACRRRRTRSVAPTSPCSAKLLRERVAHSLEPRLDVSPDLSCHAPTLRLRALPRRMCRTGSDRPCRTRSRTTVGVASTNRASTTRGRRGRWPRCWMRSSPTAAAASRPSAMSAGGDLLDERGVDRVRRPHTRRSSRPAAPGAPTPDVGPSRSLPTRSSVPSRSCTWWPYSCATTYASANAAALRAEPGAQLVVEAEVEVHLLVARAVERPDRRVGRRRTRSTPGRRRARSAPAGSPAPRPTSTPAPSSRPR